MDIAQRVGRAVAPHVVAVLAAAMIHTHTRPTLITIPRRGVAWVGLAKAWSHRVESKAALVASRFVRTIHACRGADAYSNPRKH
jgi:hypothetical protein